jgi:pSer/pThr/pTyr-binding forkhead associated (FHA) protein
MFQLYDEKNRIGYALTGLIKEIGRNEECDIAFPNDSSVSRVHARFDRVGENWMLVDLDSTNGTYVNGSRIKEIQLNPGDIVEIGEQTLRFLPQRAPEQPISKKTTKVSVRKSHPEFPSPPTTKGIFGRVKTALRKKEKD